MNQRSIIYIIAALFGIPLLIQIGAWSATDPLLAGISALFVVGILILSQLGRKCWLLIPFFASYAGAMRVVPGQFAPRDLAVGLVAVVLPVLWVTRRFPLRFRFGMIEVALLVIVLFVVQAFLRNPVGVALLGTKLVGGRPYFELIIGLVAFLILTVQVVDQKSVTQMIVAFFVGATLSAAYATVIGMFPFLAYLTYSFYNPGGTSIAVSQYLSGGPSVEHGVGRQSYLLGFYKPLTTLVLAFRSPLQLLNPRNILYALTLSFAIACVLLSGFRSGVAGVGMMLIAATFLHRRPIQLAIMGMFGIPVLAVLLVLQGSVIDLPLPAQRALSFLPADWNSRAARSAEGSSEWRFEMWKEALKSDRYIRNKWLGDGFGFTKDEMDFQMNSYVSGSGHASLQEYYLMTGTFHSGPIETIKRIGYIGLCALLIVMGVFVKASVSLVNRTRGTPYFPYAMYVALPLVILPFMFVLIFGSFSGSVSTLLMGGGALRLIQNSFEVWRRKEQSNPVGTVEDGPAA